MRIGSLFSGGGGLDCAVREVFGGTIAWHSEVDPAASKVLDYRFPGVPNLGDITRIDWTTAEPVDILCGGYPCQPFSAAGQRKGTNDERHLWPYFAEAIRRIRPRYVVLENVAGHRSMGFDSVLADLAEARYDAQWCSIRASDVGAPHRREQVFILACATDTSSDGRHEGWPESAGLVRGFNAAIGSDRPVELLPTPAAADADGTRAARGGARSDELLLNGIARAYQAGELLPTPAASRSGRNKSPSPGAAIRPLLPTPRASRGASNTETCYLLDGKAKDGGEITDLLPTPRRSDGCGGPNPMSRAERMDDVETRILRLLPTPAASDASGGGRHPDARAGHASQIIDAALLHGTPQWGKYAAAIARWEAVTRPAPSPTEMNKNGNPRLAAVFSEWMLGWPGGLVTKLVEIGLISRNDALRIIGNGVCPQQAVAALRWLLAVSRVAA